jgi:hypothetical protein
MGECHDLVYHGNGGFTWFEVWSMPVPHRRFNIRKINEFLEKMREAQEKQKGVITETTNVKKDVIPKFVSDTKTLPVTYSAKAKK